MMHLELAAAGGVHAASCHLDGRGVVATQCGPTPEDAMRLALAAGLRRVAEMVERGEVPPAEVANVYQSRPGG